MQSEVKMRDEISAIKYQVSLAETCLKRADREWAYYKNGHPNPQSDTSSQEHYLKSQKSYAAAKEHAEKAMSMLRELNEPELERKAKEILSKCVKGTSNRQKL